MILMKLSLGFLLADLYQHFGIYVVAFALSFWFMGKTDLKSYELKSQVICLHTRYGNNIINHTQNI